MKHASFADITETLTLLRKLGIEIRACFSAFQKWLGFALCYLAVRITPKLCIKNLYNVLTTIPNLLQLTQGQLI